MTNNYIEVTKEEYSNVYDFYVSYLGFRCFSGSSDVLYDFEKKIGSKRVMDKIKYNNNYILFFN